MIERPSYIKKISRYKDKDLIKTITGIRRCGKSVLLLNLYKNHLIHEGVPERSICAINLEDKENAGLRNSDILYSHIMGCNSKYPVKYVMIDEIQYVRGFEDLLNSLKNKGMDVYVTGSNSRMLSGDISTALRGRSIEIRVYPLSFREYYAYTGGDKISAFRDYMMYGGFPYAAAEPDKDLKTQYLSMLQSTVATRDIVERYGIRNATAFNAVYNYLCSNIGSLVNAKKISDTLKSNGFNSITPDTIGNYLNWLTESFLFTKIYRYDIKGREYLKTQNKYYATDIGLRNSRLEYRQIEPTHALKNIIFNDLASRGYTVNIGQNGEKEIDFIASDSNDRIYVQVSYSFSSEEKRKQELSSFKNLDDGYKKFVITMDNNPFDHLEKGYRKMNAIDFLLSENPFGS